MPSFFDALKDPEFRRGVLQGVLDASNRGAATVIGGGVDLMTDVTNLGIAGTGYIAHKAGLIDQPFPMIEKRDAVGSSEWIGKKLEQGGFISEARNPTAEFLASMAVPALMAKGGAGLYSVESKAAQNLAAPRTMTRRGERGVILYHGGTDAPASGIKDSGTFRGLFASDSMDAAKSHGTGSLYRMTVPDSKVMDRYDDVDWDTAVNTARQFIKDADMAEDIADAALSQKSLWRMSDDKADAIMRALGESDMGEADWALQMIRGQIAKAGGFKAATMVDEHGTSYLVLPGVTPRPANEKAKAAFVSAKKMKSK